MTAAIPAGSHFRGEIQPRWNNAKAAKIAYLTGLGRTSTAIAEELGDGTMPETIRAMWRRWRIGYDGKGTRRQIPVPVPLTAGERSQVNKHARKLGITPEEWLRRVAAAAIKDDLDSAVVDED